MGKIFTLISIVILICWQTGQAQRSNYIDSLSTKAQIEDLIRRINQTYDDYEINTSLHFEDLDCKRLADSLQVKSWAKTDFDRNGLTDILVLGYDYHPALCILDKGKNTYEIQRISQGFSENCNLITVAEPRDSKPLINYYSIRPARRLNGKAQNKKAVQLIYIFGGFIEKNEQPGRHHITKIEYSAGPCLGPCPVFDLSILENRSAILVPAVYNQPEVVFKTTLSTAYYQNLVQLIEYIDFAKLEDFYFVNWTCDQSCILKITYDYGKTKTIYDNGLVGTFGLRRVYDLLFQIRSSQNWQENFSRLKKI